MPDPIAKVQALVDAANDCPHCESPEACIHCDIPDCETPWGALRAARILIEVPGLYICINYTHAALFLDDEAIDAADYSDESELAVASAICGLILEVREVENKYDV